MSVLAMLLVGVSTGQPPIVLESGDVEHTAIYSWEVTDPQLYGSISISDAGSAPQGLYFKQDGTSFYILSSLVVSQYDMAIPWDVSNAVFQGASRQKDISTEDTNATDLFFKSDGTKMYINGVQGRDTNEYNLSTPWDASTAVFSTRFRHQRDRCVGLFFDSTGTRMYTTGVDFDEVQQYTLGTAWLVTNATYNRSFQPNDVSPHSVYFKPDGTKMFVGGNSTQTIREFGLSTPWDISTCTLAQTFPTAIAGNNANGLSFRDSDGGKMFIASGGGVGAENVNSVYAFNL